MMLAGLGTIRWDDIPPGMQGGLIVTAVFAVFVVLVLAFFIWVTIRSLIDRWRWAREWAEQGRE